MSAPPTNNNATPPLQASANNNATPPFPPPLQEQAVGPSGTVVALDIQKEAIDATTALLQASLAPHVAPSLHISCACHSKMADILEAAGKGSARVVCFNLGYLPGSKDKGLTTRLETTREAVEAALKVRDGATSVGGGRLAA